MAMTLLKTQNLSINIGNLSVCSALNFEVSEKQIWGIIGRNGSGKTTLLHTLANLRAPLAGQIELGGQKVQALKRRAIAQQLGVLFQQQEEHFPATVLESALSGRHPYLNAWQWESDRDIQFAESALRDAELTPLKDRAINTLSGGELQRLKIATLLTQNPKLLLLDEPTNHLDLNHQIRLLELLVSRAHQQKGALIMVLHDINLVARFCTHLMALVPGEEPKFGGATQLLEPKLLEKTYGWPITQVAVDSALYFHAQ